MNKVYGIAHQIQPTPVTCVQTCLAMALGVPVGAVLDRYGAMAMNQIELNYALTECKFVWNQFIFGTMIFNGWYFAVVPSLNHEAGNHQILIHYDEGEICILDPSPGKQYDKNGKNLKSWECLTAFYIGGRLPC